MAYKRPGLVINTSVNVKGSESDSLSLQPDVFLAIEDSVQPTVSNRPKSIFAGELLAKLHTLPVERDRCIVDKTSILCQMCHSVESIKILDEQFINKPPNAFLPLVRCGLTQTRTEDNSVLKPGQQDNVDRSSQQVYSNNSGSSNSFPQHALTIDNLAVVDNSSETKAFCDREISSDSTGQQAICDNQLDYRSDQSCESSSVYDRLISSGRTIRDCVSPKKTKDKNLCCHCSFNSVSIPDFNSIISRNDSLYFDTLEARDSCCDLSKEYFMSPECQESLPPLPLNISQSFDPHVSSLLDGQNNESETEPLPSVPFGRSVKFWIEEID